MPQADAFIPYHVPVPNRRPTSVLVLGILAVLSPANLTRNSRPIVSRSAFASPGDIGTAGYLGDNSKHVVTAPFTASTAVLDGFTVFNTPVPIGADSILDNAIPYTQSLTLSYRHSVFSFEFAALSYAQSQKNRYRYKLQGFDPDSERSELARDARPRGKWPARLHCGDERRVVPGAGGDLGADVGRGVAAAADMGRLRAKLRAAGLIVRHSHHAMKPEKL